MQNSITHKILGYSLNFVSISSKTVIFTGGKNVYVTSVHNFYWRYFSLYKYLSSYARDMIRNSSRSSCKVSVGFIGCKRKLELDKLALKRRNISILNFYSCYVRTDMAQTKGVLLQPLIAKAPQEGEGGCLFHRLADRCSCISRVFPCLTAAALTHP